MSTVVVHFEPNLAASDRESLDRLLDADARAAGGETVAVESHVYFESFEGLLAALTPKRLELLRYLHQHPARSIRALAGAIDRDYRRVHDDIKALARIGLVERKGMAVRAAHDEIKFAIRLGEPVAA